MRVAALLAGKGAQVTTVAGDASIADAVVVLSRQRIGALVVSPDGIRIEGILSERDVIRGLNDLGGAIMEQPVSSVMTTPVHTCSPEDDVDSLMSTMTDRRVRHVPVVVDGRLTGIVSIGDVVKSRIDELSEDRDKLVEYINGR